jgi:hypothetical protein
MSNPLVPDLQTQIYVEYKTGHFVGEICRHKQKPMHLIG